MFQLHFSVKNVPTHVERIEFYDPNNKQINDIKTIRGYKGYYAVLIQKKHTNVDIIIGINPKTKIRFHNVDLTRIQGRRYIEEKVYQLTTFPPTHTPPEALKRSKPRERVFSIVLGGTGTQLLEIVPVILDQKCIKIKAVFLKGKIEPKTKKLLRTTPIFTIRQLTENKLREFKDLDAVIDLTESSIIRGMWEKSVLQKGPPQPIILLGASRFLGRTKELVTRFIDSRYFQKEGF